MSRRTTPTSATLLERVKNLDDNDAWRRFYEIYAPFILGVSRSRGCRDNVANDILQETMILLMTEMPKFYYDPERGKFRAYLFRVLLGRIWQVVRKSKIIRNSDATVLPLKPKANDSTVPIADPHAVQPDSVIEDEWRKYLMLKAFERVEQQVDANTWKSFILHKVDGLTAAQIEAQFGISENSVYVNSSRIEKRLTREIRMIENEIGG